MTNIVKKLKKAIKNARDERDKTAIAKALRFAEGNGKYVVMLMDLDSDDVVVAWKKHYIATRLVNKLTKTKRHVVEKILNGKVKDEEVREGIGFVGNVVMEFMFQLNSHSMKDKAFEKAKKGGFIGTFKQFVEGERKVEVDKIKPNKKKNGKSI